MPRKTTWCRDPDAGGVKITDAVKIRTRKRIEQHAAKYFEGKYARLDVRFRGVFCYVDAYREPGPDVYVPRGVTKAETLERLRNTPTHLCRLRYFGSDDEWSFGFYKYSDEKYELCFFDSGGFFGKPEEAFEMAARVYLE